MLPITQRGCRCVRALCLPAPAPACTVCCPLRTRLGLPPGVDHGALAVAHHLRFGGAEKETRGQRVGLPISLAARWEQRLQRRWRLAGSTHQKRCPASHRVVPAPGLGIDGLAHRAQDAQRGAPARTGRERRGRRGFVTGALRPVLAAAGSAQSPAVEEPPSPLPARSLELLDGRIAPGLQRADGGGRGVEHGDLQGRREGVGPSGGPIRARVRRRGLLRAEGASQSEACCVKDPQGAQEALAWCLSTISHQRPSCGKEGSPSNMTCAWRGVERWKLEEGHVESRRRRQR